MEIGGTVGLYRIERELGAGGMGKVFAATGPDGAVVTQGNVGGFTGYSATGSTVATTAARTDAQDRLMVILADQIVTRLIAAAPAS